MKPAVVRRSEAASLAGTVLVADVRDSLGRVVLERGTRIGGDEQSVLEGLSWDVLHVVRPDEKDVLEAEAGDRLAKAAAGQGIAAGEAAGGHWPLIARTRGLVEIRRDALRDVNRNGALAIYTVSDGQVVDREEVVARVKIIPFVVDGRVLDDGVAAARAADGVVTLLPFRAERLGAVVMESLGSSALERFQRAIDEKATWFGSSVMPLCPAVRNPRSVAAAVEGLLAQGAGVVLIAGTAAMDPLDPAFEAVRMLGGVIERVGVPAHPGSLLWLARVNSVPVIGMPSCGLFSRATVFDLVLPRLLTGLTVDSAWLAELGHGGLLTRDVAARFPPYRPRQERGAVD